MFVFNIHLSFYDNDDNDDNVDHNQQTSVDSIVHQRDKEIAPVFPALLLRDGHLRILLHQLLPGSSLLDHLVQHSAEIVDGQTDLLHRVTLTQGDRAVLLASLVQSLKIDRDGEGDTDFISTGITTTNRSRGSVGLAGESEVTELLTNLLHGVVETLGVVHGHDGGLDSSHGGLEGHHRTLLLILTDVEGVLQNGVQNTTHSEGRLDDGGNELLLVNLHHGGLEGDHGGGDGVGLAVVQRSNLRTAVCLHGIDKLLTLLRLVLTKLLQVVLDNGLLLLEGNTDRAVVEVSSENVLADGHVVLDRGEHLHLGCLRVFLCIMK